jgi:hypothetical protein
MSTLVSKVTEIVRNLVNAIAGFVRKSPWSAAAAAAVLVMLFLA